MKANLTKRCIQQTLASIEALDLEPIRLKVMDAESGKGWSGDYTDRVERNYRSHLGMLAKHLDKIGDIPVSKDVDEFWHAHILHTMKYTEDCDAVFGTYLHHNPKGSSDAAGGAFCSAAVKAKEAAFCSASVRLDGAAFCSAALEAKDAAFCSAAVK